MKNETHLPVPQMIWPLHPMKGVCCFLGGKRFGIQRAQGQTVSLQSRQGTGRFRGSDFAPLTNAFRPMPRGSWVPCTPLSAGIPDRAGLREVPVVNPSPVSTPGSPAQVDPSSFLKAKALCVCKGRGAARGMFRWQLKLVLQPALSGTRARSWESFLLLTVTLSSPPTRWNLAGRQAEQRVHRCALAAEWRPSRGDYGRGKAPLPRTLNFPASFGGEV